MTPKFRNAYISDFLTQSFVKFSNFANKDFEIVQQQLNPLSSRLFEVINPIFLLNYASFYPKKVEKSKILQFMSLFMQFVQDQQTTPCFVKMNVFLVGDLLKIRRDCYGGISVVFSIQANWPK